MKTHVAEIPSNIPSRPPAIVEHVLLADLLDAFDARVDAGGLDPDEVLVVIARRKLVDFAECVRVSTWGEVLRVDAAEMALSQALDRCSIDPGDMVGVPQDRVLH